MISLVMANEKEIDQFDRMGIGKDFNCTCTDGITIFIM